MTDISIATKTDEFLIAEFNALQNRAINLDNIRSSRINFFLIATAAIGAGISSVLNSSAFQAFIVPTFTIVTAVIWLLGFLTLKQSLEDSIAIVVLLRRAGRIRLWFVKNNPTIKNHVAFEYSDDRPVMDVKDLIFRGGEAVLFILNMVAFSAFATLLLSPSSWIILIVEALATAIFIWYVQIWYAHRKLRNAQETAKGINFRFDDAVTLVTEEEQKTGASNAKKKGSKNRSS